MKIVILDTNTLLRFLLDDIPTQVDEVEKRLTQAKRKEIKLLVPQIVLFEIAYALIKEYGFGKRRVVAGLKKIVASEALVVADRGSFTKALDLFEEKGISLADCFLIFYAKEQNAELFSFDRKLISLYKQQGKK